MCGIVAILKQAESSCQAIMLDEMRDAVKHRGPDGQGTVFLTPSGIRVGPTEPTWQVGLGHRRLSILDLSPAGDQPMSYRRRYWTVYNGEVYNFIELRIELERLGHVFVSTSDTEVILAAYAEWGIDCFTRFRGMWGLVILDGLRQEAIFSRDRLGIKPLYFWRGSGLVAVISEIKQLLKLPGFRPNVNLSVAAEYLRTGYEDPDQSFFCEVRPVPAGTSMRVPLSTLAPTTPEAYWHPERVAVSVTEPETAGQLFANKLEESVRLHLRSDVPVGCALSGGLDSSAIAVIVHKLRSGKHEPFHIFSVTFPDERIDEREYVDAVLARIKATSHFVTPEPEVFLRDLDQFLWNQDEPVGSLSIYAGYCIARLTQQAGIKVTLSGQGGDEILSGYWQLYFLYLRDLGLQANLPALAAHLLGAISSRGNPDLVGQVPIMWRRYWARRRPEVGLRLHLPLPEEAPGPLGIILKLRGQTRRLHEIRRMFLPRLLRWDDRNSMAFSVEGRYPFLDHELIELCLSFAPATLYSKGWTKWPLRSGLQHLLPTAIAQRRTKFGFETPQGKWLHGPLRPVLVQWLSQDRPLWSYIDPADIEALLRSGSNGSAHAEEQYQIAFRMFVFDRWLDLFGVSF